MTPIQIALAVWCALALWFVVDLRRGSRCPACKGRNLEDYGWNTHTRCLDCKVELQ